MYNQIETILSQYELKIQGIEKGRGTYICETDKGMKVLVSFRGSKEKGEFLKRYLEEINALGFRVEQIERNKALEVVTIDEVTGESFLLKDYISGSELNTEKIEDLKEASFLLGKYHSVALLAQTEVPERLKRSVSDIVDTKQRHYRELIKAQKYIRSRKKKNEFDQIYLNNYKEMMESGEKSLEILKEQGEKNSPCLICHGDINQHNILWSRDRWNIVNFESFYYGWPMLDFSNYLRKMMEKRDWDIDLGKEIIQKYQEAYVLEDESRHQLYGLLLFPEKLWKVVNHYMSARKSWISEKDIEKLRKVINQEYKRRDFLEKLFL